MLQTAASHARKPVFALASALLLFLGAPRAAVGAGGEGAAQGPTGSTLSIAMTLYIQGITLGTVELTSTNGFFAPENGRTVGAFEAAVKQTTGRKVKFLNATGVSDGRYYADDKIEIINFGPGSGVQGHAANESVPIAEMIEAAKIQLAVVNRLLG